MIDTKVSKCYEVSLRYLQIHLMASFLSLFFFFLLLMLIFSELDDGMLLAG